MEVETSSLRGHRTVSNHAETWCWIRDTGLRKIWGTKCHICLSLHQRVCSLGSQAPETRGKVWSKEDVLLVDEDQVREHLSKLVICKSLGPNMMHPQVLRELGDVMTSFVMKCKDIPDYLRTIWQLGEMPGDWWKMSVLFLKRTRETQGTTGFSALPQFLLRLWNN